MTKINGDDWIYVMKNGHELILFNPKTKKEKFIFKGTNELAGFNPLKNGDIIIIQNYS